MSLDLIREWLGGGIVLIGAAFMIVGAIGLIRLPDVFTRMHGASVADTLGAGIVLIGLIVLAGFTLVAVKLLFLIAFFVLMGPAATHAIARAALHAGVRPLLADDGKPNFKYVATHICDSIKRQMKDQGQKGIQGEFGIGLLSFWTVGESLTLVSAGGDGKAYEMRMAKGSPTYSVSTVRRLLSGAGTELTIQPLLPACHARIVGQTVLDDEQPSFWPQDSTQFCERLHGIRY